MISADYIVVGSGLTGATIARMLADAGREVVVLERRAAVGGNVRDAVHEPSGVRYHLFGPHYFRTSSDRIWEWANRFAPFRDWSAKILVSIDGRLVRWPLRDADRSLRQRIEDAYNLKMWGTTDVPREIAQRVEVRRDDSDDRLKTDKHQGLPAGGYLAWVEEMLRGVPVVSGFDFVARRAEVSWSQACVFTGPVDELHGCRLGRLRYRCQRREVHQAWSGGSVPHQPAPQVNFPGTAFEFVRRIEWNWLAAQPRWDRGSLLTYETPAEAEAFDECEYPFNDFHNKALAAIYAAMAREDGIVPCGRLGSYKYLDMDQAIAAAMKVAEGLLK